MRRSRVSGLGLLNIFELLEETLRRARVRRLISSLSCWNRTLSMSAEETQRT